MTLCRVVVDRRATPTNHGARVVDPWRFRRRPAADADEPGATGARLATEPGRRGEPDRPRMGPKRLLAQHQTDTERLRRKSLIHIMVNSRMSIYVAKIHELVMRQHFVVQLNRFPIVIETTYDKNNENIINENTITYPANAGII